VPVVELLDGEQLPPKTSTTSRNTDSCPRSHTAAGMMSGGEVGVAEFDWT
jgi:hypothetical protein